MTELNPLSAAKYYIYASIKALRGSNKHKGLVLQMEGFMDAEAERLAVAKEPDHRAALAKLPDVVEMSEAEKVLSDLGNIVNAYFNDRNERHNETIAGPFAWAKFEDDGSISLLTDEPFVDATALYALTKDKSRNGEAVEPGCPDCSGENTLVMSGTCIRHGPAPSDAEVMEMQRMQKKNGWVDYE